MARPSALYVCGSCGGETLKWQGQCPACGEWNSLTQRAAQPARLAPRSAAVRLAAAGAAGESERLPSGAAELDRVLGGGLVPGSVTLLGGDPGIGKSTLLLQVAAHVAQSGSVLYASGEESVDQVGLRAHRLGVTAAEGLSVVAESDLERI